MAATARGLRHARRFLFHRDRLRQVARLVDVGAAGGAVLGTVLHARCQGLSLHPLQGAAVAAYQC